MTHRHSCVCLAHSYPVPSLQAALLVLLPDWCCCAGGGADRMAAFLCQDCQNTAFWLCAWRSPVPGANVCDATGLTWETPVGSIQAGGRYFLPVLEWAVCCLILHWNKFHSFGLCSYQTLLTASFPACNPILKSITMLLKWLLKCFQVVPGLQLYEFPHLAQIWISWCFSCFRFLPKVGIFGARILGLVFPFYFKVAQLL